MQRLPVAGGGGDEAQSQDPGNQSGEGDRLRGPQRGGLGPFLRMGRILGVEIKVRTSTHSQEAELGLWLTPSLFSLHLLLP